MKSLLLAESRSVSISSISQIYKSMYIYLRGVASKKHLKKIMKLKEFMVSRLLRGLHDREFIIGTNIHILTYSLFQSVNKKYSEF